VNHHNELGYNDVSVITKGGRLVVEYDRVGENQFENIWLCGPAEKVFDGDFELAT
jgi:diaminopimelate epimerase